ncbi:MAG: hypothetical protein A2X23_02440 [Chloroflexi bacterium GWC2_73_18]|nr:MAG: hypothetical protein A2X23_02440 [Chloroflexi bacterium GWC2_73_18]
MSRHSLEAALVPGRTIVLDTSAVLAYLNGNERASPAAALVIDGHVRGGRNPATISSITVTEALVRPFRSGSPQVSLAESFLGHFPNLAIAVVTYEVAREAARIRAATGLRTPDALILATAVVSGIELVVANDDRWRVAIEAAAPSLTLVHLEAHVPI